MLELVLGPDAQALHPLQEDPVRARHVPHEAAIHVPVRIWARAYPSVHGVSPKDPRSNVSESSRPQALVWHGSKLDQNLAPFAYLPTFG
eukprot:2928365-Alexandrium_andersonii.AAC.1